MTRQRRIPAAWMRGGTSKGLFMLARDLPADDATRDALLARLLGSPDPYGKQIDGLGGATSSTSKVVILAPSSRAGCDVDYLFGQVPVSGERIDWSGNCGNLTAAVGPFAISRGLLQAPADGMARVRIWQANIGKRILAQVPMLAGEVCEAGDFMLDGVAFPAAEIRLEFLDPAGSGAAGLFPTGRMRDCLQTADERIDATLINAGNPMVLIGAAALELDCSASQAALNAQPGLLARCERIRVAGALAMGLAANAAEAQARAHTPKLAVLDRAKAFRAADGCAFTADDIDLSCRVLSMGVFHHAIPGTAAIAIAAAAAIPGTVASEHVCEHGTAPLRLGQPSGCTRVGVDAHRTEAGWTLGKAVMSRSARMVMDGFVCLPG
ncbi:2-methylaconitate cis-trans isomerase PrpF [Parazoarcus communis]|uniref:2-methylaconitate cis-trans isomerase PrpF n=1 Tax=Parazoarcus communis TaxID=41977 RepID=A0A2U8GVM4_9RHOO|nr:2-methylaconitate cis-trans isomerase PrpF [Parazoarcus communis]AWI77323.1 2-methylaconitate cis-trans isomerase PrpF [Parazoarcus communis]